VGYRPDDDGRRTYARWARADRVETRSVALPVAITVVVGLAAVAVLLDTGHLERIGLGLKIGLGFLFGVTTMLVLQPLLQKASRRLRVRDGDTVLRMDRRPPVLYLRSFAVDRTAEAQRTEESLRSYLQEMGPLVALGLVPDEGTLGAARVEVRDEDWVARVVGLMESASLVLVRLGDSSSLLWEVEESLRRVPPERLIFLLLGEEPARERQYAALSERLRHLTPARPPERAPDVSLVAFDRAFRTIVQSLPPRVDSPALRLAFDRVQAERMKAG
jgi:hypothetical protein